MREKGETQRFAMKKIKKNARKKQAHKVYSCACF